MPFEYNDIHSDFITLNATQSIRLVANNIFINDVNIATSLKQLSHTTDTSNTPDVIPRMTQLESNTNSLLSNYSNLQQVLNNIKETVLSHKSVIDSNLEKNVSYYTTLGTRVNTLELVSNQLSENIKSYMETVDNISKKLKYTESNQVDIMSVITRVITLENANREMADTNEFLRKTIVDNNNKIQELSCKLYEVIENLPKPVSNNDVLETTEPEQSEQPEQPEQSEQSEQPEKPEKPVQLSRAKSIVGRKK